MIKLRPVAANDANAIAAAVDRSRDALRRWMEWYRDDYDVGSAETWIASSIADAAVGKAFHFAILSDMDVVGVVGFEDISVETGRAMTGYWLATDATRRGIGRQALALALTWLRTHVGVHTVWASVADANIASRRILEVNGFHMSGTRGIDERGDLSLRYELELDTASV